jgi:transglutaminase-like putative cysteine protease
VGTLAEVPSVRVLAAWLALALSPASALAQFKDSPQTTAPNFAREVTQRVRIGVIVKANGGNFSRIVATAPVPTDWPEQRVKIVNEDVSRSVQGLTYRTIAGGGGVKQLVLQIPQLPAGQEAKALITFEVTRGAPLAPSETSAYAIPKKLDKTTQIDIGAGPYIETRHPSIVNAAKSAVAEESDDWKKVEAIYDWVRENVKYTTGELKGAARALHDKEGDKDELVSLFVAMCRAQKIPARTVFSVGHCYAEFYLEDEEGAGHWFPCEPAGVRAFGTVQDLAPILQKGDIFKNPEKPKERLRFVTEYFNASGRGGSPEVRFVREIVAE